VRSKWSAPHKANKTTLHLLMGIYFPGEIMEYTLSSIISRSDAVARIAERTRLPEDREREARNRVSKRIGHAVNQGKLVESERGFFVFGELAAWVRNTWPGSFDDWPCTRSADYVSSARCDDFLDMVVLPGTIKSCHDLIVEMHEQIKILEQSLKDAQLEIERTRPLAEHWKELCNKNKENAGKPRQ
jgi:hypothetical protein